MTSTPPGAGPKGGPEGGPEGKDISLLSPLSQAIQAGFGTGTAAETPDILISVGPK